MNFLDYPAQEPLSDVAQDYHDEVLRRAENVEGHPYAYGENPYQRLMVFRASRPDGRVLLVFHGGGWTNGYHEWLHFMAPALNSRGIGMISAGYRLAPAHLFPEMQEDCGRALAWVAGHADITGGHPSKLYLGGHSAGGHLAALLAASGPQSGKSTIAGCLPISGIYRFGSASGLKMRPRFLGPVPDPAIDDAASPILAVSGQSSPFLIAYGEFDFPHLRQQALDMNQALRAAGVPSSTLELSGRDHFSASYAAGDPSGPWIDAADAFMDRHD